MSFIRRFHCNTVVTVALKLIAIYNTLAYVVGIVLIPAARKRTKQGWKRPASPTAMICTQDRTEPHVMGESGLRAGNAHAQEKAHGGARVSEQTDIIQSNAIIASVPWLVH